MTAPAPLYGDATSTDGLLFTSGQIPTAADGSTPAAFEDQVNAVFDNLETVLQQNGSGLADMLQLTVYLLDIEGDFEVYNTVYRDRVLPHATPARTTVQVAHFRGTKRIELQAVATTAAA